MKRKVMAVLLGSALLASCAGPGADVVETTEPSASSTAPTAVTTTTVPMSTTSASPGTSSPPTTVPDGDGASGSGCSPGDAATLPEGEWFGLVVATSAGAIEFDLACWFTGDAAIDAAAEDGEESPPPNDYYMRNENPQSRSLEVSSEAGAVWYPTGDPTMEVEGTFQEWVDGVAGRGFDFGVWLHVIDGQVVAIREQWVP